MLRVGLTGGIGCGKSTVAAMLLELGCPVIDADLLAHQLIEPGEPAYSDILREFGSGALAAGGTIDRGKLGELVFADPASLAKLNQIVHPRVIEASEKMLANLEKSGQTQIAFVEAALLIEAGYHKKLDRLIVAWCQPEQQQERLQTRGLSAAQAKTRIAAQMPIEQKRRFATDEIDCSGSLEETRTQVERLVTRLKKLAAV